MLGANLGLLLYGEVSVMSYSQNRDKNSFLWKHVKDITGQSQANKLPSALQSDQGPINNPQEIIDEMNLYFAKSQ